MILNQNMVSDAEVIYQPTIPIFDVQYRIRLPQDQIGGASASSSSPGFEEARAADSVSRDVSCFETVMDSALIAIAESTAPKYAPTLRSGSCTDIGHRTSMDDEHIRIDDLSTLLGTPFSCCNPSAFYAVFDGHGGPEAASYVKQNAMKLFFEENLIPEGSEINNFFLQELEASHRRAFLLADLALADETTVSGSCGTTAITALVLENHLMVANVGDCRAVLCRRGSAINLSQDHRPSFLPERKRVEDLGGVIYDGYLNGSLSITRALGDWELKLPFGTSSPLIADPDIQQVELTEEDEFLIIGCDGLWDVMSSQCAVSLVRRAMRRHNDPQQCAKELVSEALRLNTSDNLTAIVVSLAPVERLEPVSSRPRRMRRCSVSEEGRNRLMSLLGGGN